MTEKNNRMLEHKKLAVDSVKHITTLAAGTLVLLSTFVDKLPKPLHGRISLMTALGCMVVCLVAAFFYLFLETIARSWTPLQYGDKPSIWGSSRWINHLCRISRRTDRFKRIRLSKPLVARSVG